MKINMVSTANDKKNGSPTVSCPSTEDDNSIDLRDAVVQKTDATAAAASGENGDDDDMDDDDDDELDASQDDFTEVGSDDHMERSGNGKSDNDDNAFDVIMNKKENRWVLRSRTLVLLVLFLTAVCLAIGAAFIVKNQQQTAFETSFYASATDVVQATQHQARDTFLALSNLATSIASYTMEQSKMVNAGGRSWPFITIPNFEISGSQNSAISQALQLSIVPLVSRAIKSEWEVYSVVKQSWIQHGIDVSSSTAEAVDVPPITNYVHLGSWIESSSSDSNSNISSSSVHASSSSTTPAAMPQTGPGVPLGPAKLGLGYAPIWQQSQAPLDPAIINFDIFSHPLFDQAYQVMYASALPVLSELVDLEFLSSAGSHSAPSINPVAHHDPRFFVMQPLYPTTSMPNNKHDVVGFVVAVLEWNVLLANMLPAAGGGAAPEDVEDGPIIAVVKSSKGEAGNNVFSYSIQGPKATFLGLGDFHDSAYDHLSMHTNFAVLEPSSATTNTTNSTANGAVQRALQTATESSDGGTSNSSSCEYEIWLYPTQEMQQEYATRTPAAFATVVLFIFFLVACVFVLYDYTVQRRQNRVMAKAKRTNALVSTFFPSTVRDRILGDTLLADDKPIDKAELKKGSEHVNGNGGGGGEGKRKGKGRRKKRTGSGGAKASKNAGSLKTFLTEGGPKSEDLGTEDGVNAQGFNLNPYDTKPIADLFPHTTIMFADIVGFTAWSSVREPTQVFILLETLYHAFDQIANRRRVFKVETVGDCYVAVAGLPDPRPDHAVVMCRFARECIIKVDGLTKALETTLGPDTGDLAMRFGLHSGPVTAGVLRGDRQRFQLFGDTMNTASRIETTGARDKIHLSQECADQLIAAGKSHWIQAREDKVHAKGKGELKTFWLVYKMSKVGGGKGRKNDASLRQDPSDKTGKKGGPSLSLLDDKTQRLVDWNVDVLHRLLRQILVRRKAVEACHPKGDLEVDSTHATEEESYTGSCPGTVIDEVKEIIHLPEFDDVAARYQHDSTAIDVDTSVVMQLKEFVMQVAQGYRDNPFHNFEHASHVTMSVVKLLSRIVATDNLDVDGSTLHDHTYGITSDPLTQFACVTAALIHDVDHLGVPNGQLVKERVPLADVYKNKSVAEQNSVDVAWDLFMDPSFGELRQAICCDDQEMKRFRSLVVNSVMATDIVDKELKDLRNKRWEKAFSAGTEDSESTRDTINRKATIVIEHLIQASDVAHTMQHWHVYRKWNERLFHEMFFAWKMGRADRNPAEFWYQGEIGFFDFYIIPLAKKLKDCGVFGVSSDEYLNYAQKNRQEWELKGQEVTAAMIEKYKDIDSNGVPMAKLGDSQEFDIKVFPSGTSHSVDSSRCLSVASSLDFANGNSQDGSSLGTGSDFSNNSDKDYSSEYASSEEDSRSSSAESEEAGVDMDDLELLKEMQCMIEQRKSAELP